MVSIGSDCESLLYSNVIFMYDLHTETTNIIIHVD